MLTIIGCNPEPTPTASPATDHSFPSAEEVLALVNANMAAASAFRFHQTANWKVDQDAEDSVAKTVLQGEGKPGEDVQWEAITTLWRQDGSIFAHGTVQHRIVNGQTYSLNPRTHQWETTAGGPFSPDDPFVLLSAGKLALQGMHLSKDSLGNKEMYLITGFPEGNTDYTTVELWVSIEEFNVIQMKTTGTIASFGALMRLGYTTRLHLTNHVEITELLKAPIIVSVPTDLRQEPTPTPISKEVVSSAFGPMAVYRSKRTLFSIQYPASWRQLQSDPVDERPYFGVTFMGEPGGQLVMTEPTFQDLGYPDGLTIDAFTDVVVAFNRTQISEFKLVARGKLMTSNGAEARVIKFTGDREQRHFL